MEKSMYIVSTLDLPEEYREMLKRECGQYEVEHVNKLADLPGDKLEKVEVLLTYGNHMPEEIVCKMKSLRWIHSGQAGIDAMPKELLADMNVVVTNSRGINSITIAEYVMCMILNLERNTYRFYEAAKRAEWDMVTHLDEVAEKTITILGLGKVGMEIAKRAKAFDMKVVGVNLVKVNSNYVDEQFPPEKLSEIAGNTDYMVICMPLTKDTYYMIDKEIISKMKETAVLINVGRGPIVKTEDLVDALEHQKIRAAILDVLEEEPLLPESPLWKMDNLMITPHIAGDRQKSYMPRMMRILCKNLNIYPRFDEMENPVNVRRGF